MELNYLLRNILLRKEDLPQVLSWANPFISLRHSDFICKWDYYI